MLNFAIIASFVAYKLTRLLISFDQRTVTATIRLSVYKCLCVGLHWFHGPYLTFRQEAYSAFRLAICTDARSDACVYASSDVNSIGKHMHIDD